MKTLRNWNSLEEFGIFFITGEACNIDLRILCDLNQQGIELWRHITGSEPTNDAMNVLDEGAKCVMIPDSMIQDLFIMGALAGQYYAVIQWCFPENKAPQQYKERIYEICAVNQKEYELIHQQQEKRKIIILNEWKASSHPHSGLNNIHQMSGNPII